MNHSWYELYKWIEGLPLGCLSIIAAFIVPILAVIAIWLYSEDTIQFANSMGEKGVLVDGRLYAPLKNDHPIPLVPAGINSVTIGNFIMFPGEKGEVVAFTQGKAPFIAANYPWSWGSDTVHVDFQGSYDLPIAVWLLTDRAFGEKSVIENIHCKNADDIWSGEGQGLQVTCDVQDARTVHLTTTDASGNTVTGEARNLFDSFPFYCDSHAPDLQGLAPQSHTRGILNVYYVNEVETSMGSGSKFGVHCNGLDPPDVIALGWDSHETLLAHELGHALIGHGDEDHVDGLSANCTTMPIQCTPPPAGLMCGPTSAPCLFDRTNVMHGVSSWRNYLTEGQVFRAFFNQASVLNRTDMYNIGMGITLGRTCGGISDATAPVESVDCPLIDKRVWPDNGGEYGPWPAN